MIEKLDYSIIAGFIFTVILTMILLYHPLWKLARPKKNILLSLLIIMGWMGLQGVLAYQGFYLQLDVAPPPFPLVILPPAISIFLLLTLSSRHFILSLPLQSLTWIHIVRIPVEIVLWQLYLAGYVPGLMTFEGRNFDIIAGLSAPLVAILAFRGGRIRRNLLLWWNIISLALVLNIVVHAILSMPYKLTQSLAFDSPNVAVLYFPFIWLPALIVPIVIFCHISSIIIIYSQHTLKLKPTKHEKLSGFE